MSYELQCIDCNCNFCIHLIRDFDKTKYWENKRREDQLLDFEKEKVKAISSASNTLEENGRQGMLRKANNMKFQFDKKGLIHYGFCSKFNNKSISFIPTLCQLETQKCFKHRKDVS